MGARVLVVFQSPIVNSKEREAFLQFQIASPALLDARSLNKRVDTKFLLGRNRLPNLLDSFSKCTQLVHTAVQDKPNYHTEYWDTKEHQLLRAHLRGQRPRFKVRVRRYQDRELQYLEIKTATPQHRTLKARQAITYPRNLSKEELRHTELLKQNQQIQSLQLEPKLTTTFQRFTLLGIKENVRMTIDIRPQFKCQSQVKSLEELVIIELKQERARPRGTLMTILREARIDQMSFSKYCTASALLFPELSMPAYRAKIRQIKRRLNV